MAAIVSPCISEGLSKDTLEFIRVQDNLAVQFSFVEGQDGIPFFHKKEANGHIKRNWLKRKDFPRTPLGEVAFQVYQMTWFSFKIKESMSKSDPKAKKMAQLDKYKALIAKLESDLKGEK